VRVRVEVFENGSIAGRVEDDGEGEIAIRDSAGPLGNGLGLRVVDAFTDRWGVEEGTTSVWFEFDPPAEAEGVSRLPLPQAT
jgi:hypothetical protein